MATARLILDNVTERFLPAFKELAKVANVDFKIDKSTKKSKTKATSKAKASKKAKEAEFYELEESPAFQKGIKMLHSLPDKEQKAIRQQVKNEMY